MINNTEALILSCYPYGDTSLICNLFTKDFGRVSIISKGARKIKNPNHAILQPLQYINLHYYFKPKRNIQLLKEASINLHFYTIQDNYKKLIYSYNIIDILNQVCKIDNPNNIIFRLSKKVLKKINTCKNNEIILYHSFFLLQLFRYLGYQPIIDYCSECGQQLNTAQYNNQTGQIICPECITTSNHVIDLSKETLSIISALSNTHINKLLNIKISEHSVFNDIQQYLLYYFSFHVVNLQKLKTITLLKQC